MKIFFLLVTIILSFNLFAQQYKFSGDGLYITLTEGVTSMTVKWSDHNNQVVTKTATLFKAYEKGNVQGGQYKIKNSSDYFFIKSASWGTGFFIEWYNELDSLYWKKFVTRD